MRELPMMKGSKERKEGQDDEGYRLQRNYDKTEMEEQTDDGDANYIGGTRREGTDAHTHTLTSLHLKLTGQAEKSNSYCLSDL